MNDSETLAFDHLVEIANACGLEATLSAVESRFTITLHAHDWPAGLFDSKAFHGRRTRIFNYTAPTPLEAISGAMKMAVHALLGDLDAVSHPNAA
jgi:hypothetical protein